MLSLINNYSIDKNSTFPGMLLILSIFVIFPLIVLFVDKIINKSRNEFERNIRKLLNEANDENEIEILKLILSKISDLKKIDILLINQNLEIKKFENIKSYVNSAAKRAEKNFYNKITLVMGIIIGIVLCKLFSWRSYLKKYIKG